jgi:hypothetical protein
MNPCMLAVDAADAFMCMLNHTVVLPLLPPSWRVPCSPQATPKKQKLAVVSDT